MIETYKKKDLFDTIGQFYNVVRQNRILDSYCVRIIQLPQQKLKRLALLRNSLKTIGYTIQGFPVVY